MNPVLTRVEEEEKRGEESLQLIAIEERTNISKMKFIVLYYLYIVSHLIRTTRRQNMRYYLYVATAFLVLGSIEYLAA